MRFPDWLGRLMLWLGFDMHPSLVCAICDREIDADGRTEAESIAATVAHYRFFHPEVVRDDIGKAGRAFRP